MNTKDSIKRGIAAGGIAVPAAMIFGHSMFSDDKLLMFMAACIFISFVVIVFLDAGLIGKSRDDVN